MKKLICFCLAVLMLLSLAACGGEVRTGTTELVQKDTSATEAQTTEADTKSDTESSDKVDVDLTKMSSTMVYSEVQNMQMHPEQYLGKIVKMHGPFNVTEVENNRYFACVIKDATACCSTGIEFIWAGDHSYPDDYPESGEEITVTGVFNTYMEGKSKYLQLKDADLQF